MLRVNPDVLVQEVEEVAVFVFFGYYQHYNWGGLPVFLAETWAWALRVLRWKSSRLQVLCEAACSACGSHVGVVAKRGRF